ncbi:MAG TPA: hypothetical protein VE988_12820 [Gemmataceae bacterium]|nr:hypothetical protein [Gemmataceae bacterium]
MHFGNATVDQAARLFERFFPAQAHLACEFARLIGDRQCSMAALQDYLMLHRHDSEEALGNASDLQIGKTEKAGPQGKRQRVLAMRSSLPAGFADARK